MPAKQEGKKNFILRLFADLVNAIKTFFTGPSAKSNTETLFEKIKPTYNLPKTTDLLLLGTNSTILLIYLKPTKEVSTVLVSKIIVLSVLG